MFGSVFFTFKKIIMARKIPPKGNTAKNIKKIVQQGPKTQPSQTLSKGQTQSFVQHVQKSRVPTPSQNQRGKIKSIDSKDLTR